MARRIRDYHAEEQRRNELARERGFTSRAQQRGTTERERDSELAGFDSPEEYSQARRELSRWSRKSAKLPVTRYEPRGRDRSPEYFGAHFRAFDPDIEHGFRWSDREGFREFMTTISGYYTDAEFEARYGKNAGSGS